ncbi:MAG: hypothetical protein ACI85I_001245, partial [Arenicella sp.]
DSQVEKLPISNIPSDILKNDPNFKYKPLYKLTSKDYSAQVGYDVISLHVSNEYKGWNSFSGKIFDFYEKILSTKVISGVDSLTIRYLNFFNLNIFDKIILSVNLGENPYESDNLVIRTEKVEEEFTKVLQIANNVNFHKNESTLKGSLIDISCVLKNPTNFAENWKQNVEKAHEIEKTLFFELLKPDFLKTLNPKYDE